MELLLVGEAPNASGRGRMANTTQSGRRLALLGGAGLPRTNVIQRFPARSGKGASFPLQEARAGLDRLWRRTPRRVAFVYMGKRVAAADGWRGAYLEWGESRGRRVCTFPHPSGINMWWNEPANVELAMAFIRGVGADIVAPVNHNDDEGDEMTQDQRVHARFERDAHVRRTLNLCIECGQSIGQHAEGCATAIGKVVACIKEKGSNTRRWTDADHREILLSICPTGRVSRKRYAAERAVRGGVMAAESSIMRRFKSWPAFLDTVLAA
jgi:hypothetical protein